HRELLRLGVSRLKYDAPPPSAAPFLASQSANQAASTGATPSASVASGGETILRHLADGARFRTLHANAERVLDLCPIQTNQKTLLVFAHGAGHIGIIDLADDSS